MTIDSAVRVHRGIAIVVAFVMAVDLVLMLLEAQWQNAFRLIVIVAIILLPRSLQERGGRRIPQPSSV